MVSFYVDLAIGLILAFLLLSLLVSGLNEGIVRLLGIRSKFLWAYLRDTLDGGEVVKKVPATLGWLDKRLKGVSRLGRRLRGALGDLLPTHNLLRSRLPATALGVFAKLPFGRDPRPEFSPQPAPMQSPPLTAGPPPVTEKGAPAHHGKSLTELLHERLQEIDVSKLGRTTIADIPPSRFSVAILEIASERGGVPVLLSELETLHSPFYRPLAAIWQKAGGTITPTQPQQRTQQTPDGDPGLDMPPAVPAPLVDLEAFRKSIEEWFNDEMERLTVLYRRFVRWAVAVVALFVTLFFSMDSLEYGKTLLNDSAYRSSVAAFADQGEVALQPIKDQCAPGQDTYQCVTDVLSTPAFVKIFTHAPVSAQITAGGSPSWNWNWSGYWDRLSTLSHWPGYLLTLLAILFGAPFWWDMLRRITGLKKPSNSSSD